MNGTVMKRRSKRPNIPVFQIGTGRPWLQIEFLSQSKLFFKRSCANLWKDNVRPHPMIIIRHAEETDLPAIVDIYNQSIPAGRSTADTNPIPVSQREAWFRRFDPEKRPIWVALDGETVVGCVYLSWFYEGRPAYDKTAEISTYIATGYQGRGLGTRLKKEMIAACPKLGVENLLSLYFDHNEATKKINQNLGFEVVGHLPEIAEVFGKKRGLMIGLLRLTKQAEDPRDSND